MPPEEDGVHVHQHLKALGISQLSEWDALAFLYRHGTSLIGAAQIAQLLGGNQAEVSAALNRLETLGLLQRSRGSGGIRLYRFSVPKDPFCYSCLVELMSLAEKRTGRLLLLKHLHRGNSHPFLRSRGLSLV
jgi:hypothetical protein